MKNVINALNQCLIPEVIHSQLFRCCFLDVLFCVVVTLNDDTFRRFKFEIIKLTFSLNTLENVWKRTRIESFLVMI